MAKEVRTLPLLDRLLHPPLHFRNHVVEMLHIVTEILDVAEAHIVFALRNRRRRPLIRLVVNEDVVAVLVLANPKLGIGGRLAPPHHDNERLSIRVEVAKTMNLKRVRAHQRLAQSEKATRLGDGFKSKTLAGLDSKRHASPILQKQQAVCRQCRGLSVEPFNALRGFAWAERRLGQTRTPVRRYAVLSHRVEFNVSTSESKQMEYRHHHGL